MNKFNLAGPRAIVNIGSQHLIVVLHSYTFFNNQIESRLLCAHIGEFNKAKPPYLACSFSLKENKIVALESHNALIDFIERITMHGREAIERLEGLSCAKLEKIINYLKHVAPVQYSVNLVQFDPCFKALLDSSENRWESVNCKVFWGNNEINPVKIERISGHGAFERMLMTFNADYISHAKIDARDDVQVKIDTGEGLQNTGNYYPIKVDFESPTKLTVVCGNFSEEFKKSIIPLLSIVQCEAGDLFYLLCRMQGMPKEKIHIDGFKTGGYYSFTVIFPVQNISFSKSFGLGMVNYCIELDEILTERLGRHLEKNDNVNWIENSPKAIVNLTAHTFYDAYVQASELVEESIDLLTHLARQSTLYENYNASNNLINWRRDLAYPQPAKSTLVFMVNNTMSKSIVFDSKDIIVPQVLDVDSFTNRISNFVAPYEISMVNTYQERGISKNVREQLVALNFSLRWLRRAWEANTVEDKIIYIITALEYSLVKVKGSKLLKGEVIKEVICGAVERYKEVLGENIENEDISVLKDKIKNALTNPPLWNRVLTVISDVGVLVSDDDLEVLYRARRVRNALIHEGKKMDFSIEEAKKAHSVVSRIVAARIKILIKTESR